MTFSFLYRLPARCGDWVRVRRLPVVAKDIEIVVLHYQLERTAADALDRLEPALRAAAADPGGSLHFRRHLGRLTRVVQATCLLDEAAADAAAGIATTKADVAAFFVRRHLVPGYDPAEDPSYLTRIDAVLTEDPHTDGADRAGRPDAVEARA